MSGFQPQASKPFTFIFLGLLALSIIVGGIGFATREAPKATQSEVNTSSDPQAGLKLLKAARKEMIALIRLEGPITSDASGNGFLDEASNAQMVRKALDEAAEDTKVKGVVLLINSPGGTVAMSQALNQAVQRVRVNKPIVASLLDVAASGGYYTAVAADKIITHKGTLTASIGVIMQTLNMQELFNEKLGIKATTIKSGKFKDLLNPYRETEPAEVALLQRIIDTSYDDFLEAVLAGRLRNMKDAEAKAQRAASIKAVADGRIVTGVQAVETGLADEIGDLRHAKEVVQRMINERLNRDSETEYNMMDYDAHTSVLQLFGLPILSGKAPAWLMTLANIASPLPGREAALLPQASVKEGLPFSIQHANQPLWLYE